MTNEAHEELSPLKRALLAIKELQARVKQLEQEKREPIAVIGMACRFPGGGLGPDAFWDMLCQGVDASREVPADRWDAAALYDADPKAAGKMYVRRGSFLDDPRGFDPEFFAISPREAEGMDPQQRMLLEVAWEALEHAGLAADRLVNSTTGVYVGLMGMDYGQLMVNQLDMTDFDPYTGSGMYPSFPAGRLSFNLGLQGPSMVVATACSSSLVSSHLACQALRNRECELALSGGVSLIFAPGVNVYLSRMALLSPDGRSKIFDERADGYGRGEGCGVVVLKRLSDAVRDRDSVYAVIRGGAFGHVGPSGGLTVPNGPALEKMLRRALESAGVTPEQVGYVEVGATGTAMADPIEVSALNEVFGQRAAERPLYIGSLKTNIGHLEAASGVAGLIKACLMLHHRKIPAHLHLQTANPKLPWQQMPLSILTRTSDWPENCSDIVGVSAIGLSGINAHLVLERAPEVVPVVEAPARPLQLLALSAKSDAALRQLAGRYQSLLQADLPLAALCASAARCRVHHDYRLALVVASLDELRHGLAQFLAGASDPSWHQGRANAKPAALPFQEPVDADGLSRLLHACARHYVDGGDLPSQLFPEHFQRLTLPTYPFEHRELWPLALRGSAASGRPQGNPLLIHRQAAVQVTRKHDGQCLMIPVVELGQDPELAERVWQLGRIFAMAPGCVSQVTGRAYVFINENATAYFFCNFREHMLVAQVYTGPEEAHDDLVRALLDHCDRHGLELNLIVEQERFRARLERMGFSSTVMGVWQNLEDLANYGLEGNKMRRLRYAVSQYRKLGGHQTQEYRLGSDPQVESEMLATIEAWQAHKGANAGPLVDHLKEALTLGWPGSESRIFLVRRDGVLEGVLMVLPVPGLDDNLMDVEFYRPDVPMGSMECGILDIIELLKAEGKSRFTLGLTPMTQLEPHPNEDPAVRAFFEGIHAQGRLNGDANFQFKNKFRPSNTQAWLCRPRGLGVTYLTEFLMMMADPTNAAVVATAAKRKPVAAAVLEPSLTCAELDAADGPERHRLLAAYLRRKLAAVLHADPEHIDTARELHLLGVDSLMVMELRNEIHQDLGVEIPAVVFFEFPSLLQLAEIVAQHYDQANAHAAAPDQAVVADAELDVTALSNEELDAMLARMMAEEQDS